MIQVAQHENVTLLSFSYSPCVSYNHSTRSHLIITPKADNSGTKPPPPTRKISEDLQTQLQAVEKGLADRPEKKDLIDRGILKGM